MSSQRSGRQLGADFPPGSGPLLRFSLRRFYLLGRKPFPSLLMMTDGTTRAYGGILPAGGR
jgi:hypothetical protein